MRPEYERVDLVDGFAIAKGMFVTRRATGQEAQTFRLLHPNGLRVDLILVNHYGSPEYYADITRRLNDADAVIYEGVSEAMHPKYQALQAKLEKELRTLTSATLVDVGGDVASSRMQRACFDAVYARLGMVYEFDVIKSEGEHWYSGDDRFWLALGDDPFLREAYVRRFQEASSDSSDLVERVLFYSAQTNVRALFERVWTPDLFYRHLYQMSCPEIMGQAALESPPERDVMVLDTFDATVAKGYRHVAIKFGAVHGPPLLDGLIERGLMITNSENLHVVRW